MTEKVRDLMAALEASLARIKEEQAERAIGDGHHDTALADERDQADNSLIGPE